jgi:hypothetical protein
VAVLKPKKPSQKQSGKSKPDYFYLTQIIRIVAAGKKKNPLTAWNTFMSCRKQEKPIPEWVLKYFDQVAADLLAVPPSGDGEEKDRVWKALGLNTFGPGTAHSRHLTAARRRKAVLKVIAMRWEDPNMSVDAACTEVAGLIFEGDRRHIESDTVKKWYYELLSPPAAEAIPLLKK